jgi:Kef-type K+ transport system membrane component KefB
VLLVATRGLGELAVRLGQPSLVGELLAGMLIGALVARYGDALPILSGLGDDRVFAALTDLGIFFLMLMAGLELRPRKLAEASGLAFAVALGGLLLPFALGVGVGLGLLPPSELRGAQSLFLGVALAITAVPVSVGVLLAMGRLDTRMGHLIVSAAIVDDVLSLVLLAGLTAVLRTGSVPDLGVFAGLAAKVALFFVVAMPFGQWVFPRLGNLVARLRAPELQFSFLVLVGLAYAVLAEALAMHFLIGAFLAGLYFQQHTIDEETFDDVFRKVSALTQGFFAPVFFASIGLHLEAGALLEAPLLVALLLVAATIGKLAGAGIPARLGGLGRRDALAVGVGMNARGAVELIIADVAFRAGLFEAPDPPPAVVRSLYSAVVLTAIVTTLATPLGLRALYREGVGPPRHREDEVP